MLNNIEASATSPYSIPRDFPAYTQIIDLDRVNDLLLAKPDRDWDKAPSVASSSPSSSRPETPFFMPVLDEAFHVESARRQAKSAAHNIKIWGGNAEDLRALINSKSYWEIEALHYMALLHRHLDRFTDVVAYWQQESARQKEVLARWVSLIECRADDRPEEMGTPIHHNEEADCIPEKREALYYTAILHKYLDRAVDAIPYWKEEAAYQREALTRWVPSLEDAGDFLRYNIDRLGYWQEESRYLTVISLELAENLKQETESRKTID